MLSYFTWTCRILDWREKNEFMLLLNLPYSTSVLQVSVSKGEIGSQRITIAYPLFQQSLFQLIETNKVYWKCTHFWWSLCPGSRKFYFSSFCFLSILSKLPCNMSGKIFFVTLPFFFIVYFPYLLVYSIVVFFIKCANTTIFPRIMKVLLSTKTLN